MDPRAARLRKYSTGLGQGSKALFTWTARGRPAQAAWAHLRMHHAASHMQRELEIAMYVHELMRWPAIYCCSSRNL